MASCLIRGTCLAFTLWCSVSGWTAGTRASRPPEVRAGRPDISAQERWLLADEAAFRDGRIIKPAAEPQGGFNGRGFHFSPAAAWPYVQKRVGTVLAKNPYSAWFVDCDATAECFDDLSPLHPATRCKRRCAGQRNAVRETRPARPKLEVVVVTPSIHQRTSHAPSSWAY